MSQSNTAPLILLDSDVIRHFISGNQLHRLASIYPNRFVILDKVKVEICRSKQLKSIVEDFIKQHKISVIPFPKDMAIIIEYAYLRKEFGDGESACMAVAKHQNKFIASSNLKDISKFCQTHGITYLTTMDILEQAYLDGILSQTACNQFITDVLDKGSKLPYKNLEGYLKSKK